MIRNLVRCCMVLVLATSAVFAETPNLQTPAPVIYLVDNLDEPDRLGWCIDTQGRGFGAFLHAHSCKPQGGDVQFAFETETGLIRSVAFPAYCMVYDPDQTSPLGLVNCDADSSNQAFAYSPTGEVTLQQQPAFCLAVGPESTSAGPFMSRDLDMLPCAEVPEAMKLWKVAP